MNANPTSVADELDVAKDIYAAISGIDASAAARICAWAVCRRQDEEKRQAMNDAVADLKTALADAVNPYALRPKPS